MKLSNIVKIFNTVCELMNEQTSFSFAHALCMAKKELMPHVEFYTEKELEIINKYACEQEDGEKIDSEGHFKILTENIENYSKEKKDLNNVEININKVKALGTPNTISGNQLENLNYIMDFDDTTE